jgi:hypothetical protein
MVVDYLHPRKYPVIGRIATWTLRSATVGVLIGVYQFNTNDIGACYYYFTGFINVSDGRAGLTELIGKVWSA